MDSPFAHFLSNTSFVASIQALSQLVASCPRACCTALRTRYTPNMESAFFRVRGDHRCWNIEFDILGCDHAL